MHRVGSIVAGGLLLVGCSMHNPSVAKERVQLKQGQVVQSFRLVRVSPDGKAEFHGVDPGDHDVLPHFNVAAGQSFKLETQSRRRTLYTFTVEQTDPARQEATVVVQTTVN